MRTALADFNDSLARVRGITVYIDANAPEALGDRAVLDRHEFMQSSSVVILCGFFESFLKEVAEKFVADVCSLNIPFVNLPDKMRQAHYEFGGRALTQRAKDDRAGRPSRIAATCSDIASRLSAATVPPYSLVWEAFADTRSNPGSQTVDDYLRRFGLQAPWDKIGQKAGRSPETLKIQLDSFLSLRHECAHTGTVSSVPTPGDIRGFIDLVGLIGTSIVEALEDHLATMGPAVAP
jgi:hypothetical protein